MTPRTDVRCLVVLAANGLLAWLLGAANHHLASAWFPFAAHFTVHLYAGGLLVTFAALRLDPRNGLVAVLATGLLTDALEPVPLGTNAALLGLVFFLVLRGRQRFPREETVFSIVVALLANLLLFIARSFLFVGGNPHPAEAWLRIFTDLVASQLVIVLVTPWFLALQNQAFELVGIHPETGRRAVI